MARELCMGFNDEPQSLWILQTLELLLYDKCHVIIPPPHHHRPRLRLVGKITLTMTQVNRMLPQKLTDLVHWTHGRMKPLLMKVQIYYK